VPEPIRARPALIGGDVEGAQTLFERSDSAGSFEWTRFCSTSRHNRMSQSSFDAARGAIEALARRRVNECEAVVVRRRLAALDGTNDRIPMPATPVLPAAAWSSNGSLSVCIDPEAGAVREISTKVEAPAAALVTWGWNDGREGILQSTPAAPSFAWATSGHGGRQTFFIRSNHRRRSHRATPRSQAALLIAPMARTMASSTNTLRRAPVGPK